jgi:hypothetical protein
MNKHDLEEDFPLSGGEEPDDKVDNIMIIISIIVIIGVLAYTLVKIF